MSDEVVPVGKRQAISGVGFGIDSEIYKNRYRNRRGRDDGEERTVNEEREKPTRTRAHEPREKRVDLIGDTSSDRLAVEGESRWRGRGRGELSRRRKKRREELVGASRFTVTTHQKAPSGGCESFAFSLLAIARRRSISTALMVLPRTQFERTGSFFGSTCAENYPVELSSLNLEF